VSGVVVFARTSTAARRLSEQFRKRTVEKRYWALVQGKISENGRLVNYLARRQTKSRVVEDENRGQRAELSFERLAYKDGVSWVEVDLATGRHHQIRVQFAHFGHPLLGDYKYGSRKPFPNRSVALHARSLSVVHPTKKEQMTFEAEPEAFWPKQFT
jgi:23S rRNA-/tRNA-specific pseudouridylate synthase